MTNERPESDLLYRRFAPLRRVAARLASSTVPVDTFFNWQDFMFMNWCRDDRPAAISLFKHIDTRCYLNLDAEGNAYRYLPPAEDDRDGDGTYVLHSSLRDALDDLGLWEMPWLRPELADHRGGRTWDQRWERYEALTGHELRPAS